MSIGPNKLDFCNYLGNDWKKLADYLKVPASDQRHFERGEESREIWEWLENRRKLGELPTALAAVDRKDLIKFLNVTEPIQGLQSQITSPGIIRYCLDRWFPALHRFLTRAGTLSEPEELPDIRHYLHQLSATIRNDLHEKTYLPLAGRPVLPTPITQAISRDPFVSPIHQIILQLVGRAQGGDSASAQIAAVNRRSRIVRNILTLLDRTEDPLMLLGEPGSGKTMTLQQAAMMLADRESRRVFPRVPIYVRLEEFHVEGKVDADDVWEYVKQSTPLSIRPRLEELEDKGRLVIIFDGMDEMSRERYSEHTEALNLFADCNRRSAKTLFSCRITDFSPAFIHQRLVILPFNRSRVAEYRDKYIEHFPILINGRDWKRNELAKTIIQGELPIEANNPFVLWLLCLYLQDKASWPGSRVELLHFYNQQNYRRKDEERAEDEPPFPDMNAVFQEWARFAYEITVRNRGPVIPISELQSEHDMAAVLEMIRVGKRYGVLKESSDKYEHLIRFEHHRFQEYFAAFHIYKTRPQVNWLDKFDTPRWQGTMLNLLLMDEAADDVVCIFAGSIVELTQRCQVEIETIQKENERRKEQQKENAAKETTAEDQPDENKDQKELELMEVVLPDKYETVLADRVELSSRIMRQSSSNASSMCEALMPRVVQCSQMPR